LARESQSAPANPPIAGKEHHGMSRDEILAANPIAEFLRSRGHELKPAGKNFVTSGCPVTQHKRGHRPVTIDVAKEIWHCNDCDVGGSVIDWIKHAKNVTTAEAMRELGGGRNDEKPRGKIVCVHDYTDEHGKLLFQVCRFHPKDFKARRGPFDPECKRGIKGVQRVLYRLAEVIPAQSVCITEGEKNADDLAKLGFVATTNPFGAGKWRDEYSDTLRGKDVVVFGDIGDADRKGERHTQTVLPSLSGKVRSLKHAIQPDGFHDVSDWIVSLPKDKARQAVEKLIEETPLWQPPEPEATSRSVVQWFQRRFPALTEAKFGNPVSEETNDEGIRVVTAISQPYLAATLGELGSPQTPTVYIAEEDRFYSYSKTEGIYVEVRAPEIMAHFANLLWEAARENPKVLTRKLEFGFRDASRLTGPIAHARGCLVKPCDYFDNELTEYIPCHNGMLRLADRKLLPFASSYRRRNKLAVRFDPLAKCPIFLETLMKPALEPDDLDLLQRACGLFLIGKNLAQKIILLIGTAGGGKGTFIRVLCGVIGLLNVAALRTQLLIERFETGRFLGKTLLYGADVLANFLNTPGASVLKMLVGGDPTTFEFKGSNERPNIVCYFNAVVSCNSRLVVHLEGDAEAWRRRLVIIDYHKPKPKAVIPKLSDLILANEAPGVLNWMLEGLDKLRADDWQLLLTGAQEKPVNDLLLESDSHAVFAREKLAVEHDSELTVTEAFDAYVKFCNEREWSPATRRRFGGVIGDIILREFGLVDRNDIKGSGSKSLRGWKGLRLIAQPNSDPAPNP
jgi:P4 family phage/plasmid primase-like protien